MRLYSRAVLCFALQAGTMSKRVQTLLHLAIDLDLVDCFVTVHHEVLDALNISKGATNVSPFTT
jgi:hypothetical protein